MLYRGRGQPDAQLMIDHSTNLTYWDCMYRILGLPKQTTSGFC